MEIIIVKNDIRHNNKQKGAFFGVKKVYFG